MQKLKPFIDAFKVGFAKVFHKRSIIILSEQKVHHIHISGAIQFIVVMAMGIGICWSSYSTGSFMAARDKLREQGETIRSVTSEKVNSNFNTLLAASVQPTGKAKSGFPAMLSEPTLSLTMVNHDKLFERISYLEGKVAELKNANDSIIQTVREKTGGQISDLERIIRHTGLNPDKLKRQAMVAVKRRPAPPREDAESLDNSEEFDEEQDTSDAAPRAQVGGQGGPFIPADTGAYYEVQEREISSQLDELMTLGRIFQALPLARPMQGGSENSNFGRRVDPFTGRLAFHAGVDISGPSGTEIKSTNAGIVTFAGRSGAYGQVVDIDHGLGISTRYGHLRRILVTEGQSVSIGTPIGIQGSTGRSTGEHVHYEVRYNDKPLNPKNFLDAANALQ